MRLNKFLSQAGVISRRKADKLIEEGQIKVNGKTAVMGMQVDETADEVVWGSKKIELQASGIYIALNKPSGYICSASSAQGKTVFDLIKGLQARVYPVGRLDKDSRGLILLTNDGDFAYKLTQAKFEHEKEYEVELDRPLTLSDKKVMEAGMTVDGEKLRPVKISNLQGKKFNIILKQGINRQIRRMAEEFGQRVVDLNRVRIGKLRLGHLKSGEWREIKPEEVL